MDPWVQAGACFVEDDGGLPEVSLGPMTFEEIGAVHAMVRSLETAPKPASALPPDDAEGFVLSPTDDLGARMALGDCDVLNFWTETLSVNAVLLPPIGLTFWQDRLSLYYGGGPNWTPLRVRAFFELLGKLADLVPSAAIACEPEMPDPDRFLAAWNAYRAEQNERQP